MFTHIVLLIKSDWTQIAGTKGVSKSIKFLSFVSTVLRRIKVTFIDTIVRIEHQPLDLETGIALEVHIKRWVVVIFLFMKLAS